MEDVRKDLMIAEQKFTVVVPEAAEEVQLPQEQHLLVGELKFCSNFRSKVMRTGGFYRVHWDVDGAEWG